MGRGLFWTGKHHSANIDPLNKALLGDFNGRPAPNRQISFVSREWNRFQATVFYDGRVNELEVDFQSLSHVSPYGDDPHCVVKTHNTLSLFCVCHDRVKK